ncbi:hypothetical protein IJ750_07305 [bacterium]|nr:hypothetical protein [bacterium]
MKKLICVAVILGISGFCFAEENLQPLTMTPSTVAQKVVFEHCSKIFKVNQEKLFYLTLASISANRFSVDEIQTTNGYIIFSANRNKYLATIAKIDNSNAILKITPCNNIYNFPPGIITNTFKYIDLNIGTEIKS